MSQPKSLQKSNNINEVIRKARQPRLTTQTKNKIVKTIAETGDEATACATYNVGAASFRLALEKDHSFAERVSNAKRLYLAELEQEAKRRAVNGVTRKKYYQGEEIGEEQEYSDKLMVELLRAAAPEKYSRKTNVENNTTVNVEADQGMRQKLAAALKIPLNSTPTPLEDEDAIDGEYQED